MRRRWLAGAGAGLATVAVLLFAALASAAGPIELASGTVKKVYGVLVAGESGAVYALPEGIRLKADPGTAFKVFATTQKLQLTPGQLTCAYSVFVREGRLEISVPEKQSVPSAVLVTAPKQTTAIVMKGEASVFASEARAVVVNRGGSTLTRAGAGWATLGPGALRFNNGRTPQGVLEKTISEPGEIAGSVVRTAFHGSVSLSDLSWSKVDAAQAYELVLVERPTGKEVVRTRTAATRLEVAPSVGPGVYEVSVKAIDSRGIDSSHARSLTLWVLGAELPEGSSFGANDSVYLGARSQVKLLHTRGLQLTYGKAEYYVDVPSAVGLYRNAQTSVTLKDPKSGGKLRLQLLPRALVAQIQLSPRSAVWPRDKVEIQVKMIDPRGPNESAEVQPRLELSLGLTPLKAVWKQKGNLWRTTVEPQGGSGPWVLRVSVADPQGTPLGHDFVEIASPPPLKSGPGSLARR